MQQLKIKSSSRGDKHGTLLRPSFWKIAKHIALVFTFNSSLSPLLSVGWFYMGIPYVETWEDSSIMAEISSQRTGPLLWRWRRLTPKGNIWSIKHSHTGWEACWEKRVNYGPNVVATSVQCTIMKHKKHSMAGPKNQNSWVNANRPMLLTHQRRGTTAKEEHVENGSSLYLIKKYLPLVNWTFELIWTGRKNWQTGPRRRLLAETEQE